LVRGLEGLLVTVQEIRRLVTLRLDLGNMHLVAAEEVVAAEEALGESLGQVLRLGLECQTPLCLLLLPLQKSWYL